ncbi:MAG: anti-sigma factor [Acidimicrobiia bacterium]|nr:anti-sigma factor [Acidimicrobiia bacterium]
MSEPMHDLAAAYALHALDDLERARFEHHVETCPECAEEVAQMAETAAALAATVAEEPPAAMRGRVLAAIESVPQEGAAPAPSIEEAPAVRRVVTPVWSWIAVAAVLAVAVLSWTALRSTDTVEDVLAAPDAVRSAAVATDDGAGRFASATVVHSAELGQAVLIVDGLAAVGDDRTYEAWVIDATSVSPAGLFVPDEDGAARIQIEGTVGPGVIVAVTEETAGGADTPQGAVLFTAEVDA